MKKLHVKYLFRTIRVIEKKNYFNYCFFFKRAYGNIYGFQTQSCYTSQFLGYQCQRVSFSSTQTFKTILYVENQLKHVLRSIELIFTKKRQTYFSDGTKKCFFSTLYSYAKGPANLLVPQPIAAARPALQRASSYFGQSVNTILIFSCEHHIVSQKRNKTKKKAL